MLGSEDFNFDLAPPKAEEKVSEKVDPKNVAQKVKKKDDADKSEDYEEKKSAEKPEEEKDDLNETKQAEQNYNEYEGELCEGAGVSYVD